MPALAGFDTAPREDGVSGKRLIVPAPKIRRFGGGAVTERPIGERVAHIEGALEQVLPSLKRMEDKLDTALETIKEKGSRQSVAEAHAEIDKLQLAMEKKADRAEVETKAEKTEVDAVRSELKRLGDRILIWTGAGAVLMVLATWYGQKLLALLAK